MGLQIRKVNFQKHMKAAILTFPCMLLISWEKVYHIIIIVNILSFIYLLFLFI